ncbi:MAG: chromosomal replication initiator protein DnaA [candidate division CPR2 bacterium GW2011_GWD2_39_7]|nr:MAG: chromosomal replication initiator protein DnaA [candidate division CPR2 bacterium GW2011_GWD2_39_7]
MDNTSLWQAVLGQLEVTLSKANFATWFKNTSVLEQQDQKVVISVPNVFTKEWLEKKYHHDIFNALRDILNGHLEAIEYKVGSGKSLVHKRTQSQPTMVAEEALVQIEETPISTEPTTLNSKLTFDTFVVGTSNRLAYAACQSVSNNPGHTYIWRRRSRQNPPHASHRQ